MSLTLDPKAWFSESLMDTGIAFSLKTVKKLHEEQSPFQFIEIYETETFGTLMVIDGAIMLSDRDNFLYHEMMSHPVLFTHANPKRVLIIGGGDCGTLREVLKHPGVEKAQQVDIDERVTRLAEKYFPELCDANGDPRAELHFADGIKWVKEAADGSYDVIIIDSTDPVGPAEGLFTKAFYKDCFRSLAAGGYIVQQSESPLLHMHLIRDIYHALDDAGFRDIATLNFPQCVYPSGWWSATMACKDGPIAKFRREDAAKADLKTHYYTADIHQGALAIPPFFKQALYKD